MIRPMTSDVSALSGIVANGHQAIHSVSSAPSKIPYGGFSPVRLQTGCQERPSPSRTGLIRSHSSDLFRTLDSVVGLASKRHARPLTRTCPSSGPWLPSRFCCPAGSSLTMATSAPLHASQRLMNYSRVALRYRASGRGSPIYPVSPCAHAVARTPVVPTSACNDFFPAGISLRPICTGSATTNPTSPDRVGSVTKLQRSLNAMAWCAGLPCSGQNVYNRAFVSRVAPILTSVMTRWIHRQFPSPVFHRLDCQSYGLQADGHRWKATHGVLFGRSVSSTCLWNLCSSVSICGFDSHDLPLPQQK